MQTFYALLPPTLVDTLLLDLGGFLSNTVAQIVHAGSHGNAFTIDFHLAHRIGFGAGATLRLAAFDLSLAYQHTMFGKLDNGGQGKLRGVSGDLTSDNRTLQTVNGGSATSSLNEIALGATYHF